MAVSLAVRPTLAMKCASEPKAEPFMRSRTQPVTGRGQQEGQHRQGQVEAQVPGLWDLRGSCYFASL